MSKPVAVIRKVEDSPDWLDRRLVEAYLRTSYQIKSKPFPPIRIGVTNPLLEGWLDEHHFKSYAFITAWNPFSKLLHLPENQRRNKDLETELKNTACFILPGFGIGEDDNWPPEESFFAPGIAAEDAIRLGRKYGQNAIVCWEKGGLPELWWL